MQTSNLTLTDHKNSNLAMGLRKRFKRFKNGNSDVNERCGQPKQFEDEELRILLNENLFQTQKEFAKLLNDT